LERLHSCGAMNNTIPARTQANLRIPAWAAHVSEGARGGVRIYATLRGQRDEDRCRVHHLSGGVRGGKFTGNKSLHGTSCFSGAVSSSHRPPRILEASLGGATSGS